MKQKTNNWLYTFIVSFGIYFMPLFAFSLLVQIPPLMAWKISLLIGIILERLCRISLYVPMRPRMAFMIPVSIAACMVLFIIGTVHAGLMIFPDFFLVKYFLMNATILYSDTVMLLDTVPFYAWIALLVCIAILVINQLKAEMRYPAETPGSFEIAASSMFIIFPALIFMPYAHDELHLKAVRRPQKEYSGPVLRQPINIVIFILESASTSHSSSAINKHIIPLRGVCNVNHFFVPVPHSTNSIFTLLTGRYANNGKRPSWNREISKDSLANILAHQGYDRFFITSGTSKFENLSGMLTDFGFSVIDMDGIKKIYGETSYKSFSWGIDDKSVRDVVLKTAATSSKPFFIVAAYSNAHSPYFYPPQREQDNLQPEERHAKSVEYAVLLTAETIRILQGASSRDTLFIILSDHGESFGERGHERHDFSLFNEEIRVPCVFLHPELAGRRLEAGSLIDLYPTILALNGISLTNGLPGMPLFDESYSLSLLCRTWGSYTAAAWIGENTKWIYLPDEDKLIECDLDDAVRRFVTEKNERDLILEKISGRN